MSSDPYRPMSNFPPEQYVERRSGCSGCFVGCSLFVLVFFGLIGWGAYLALPGFVAYGVIQKDLTEYKEAIERSNLDPKTREALIKDLDAVRLSIDQQSQFEFFQWLSVDTEIDKILNDRQIDVNELAKLKTEIDRMKKVQGLPAK
jgi:hypothetical protein